MLGYIYIVVSVLITQATAIEYHHVREPAPGKRGGGVGGIAYVAVLIRSGVRAGDWG